MEEHSVIDPAAATLELPQGQASDARRFIRRTLTAWQLGDLVRGAVMVGHELVANALRHGTPPALIRLLRRDDALIIEVTDASPVEPRVPEIDNHTSTSGRGMRIVTSIARDWGVRAHTGGKIVWAELAAPRLPAQVATASDSQQQIA